MLQLLVNGHLDCSRRRDAPEESNAGGVLSGSSSVQLSAAPRAVSFAKALHSAPCTERPTSITPAPARVTPSRRKGAPSLTLGPVQESESNENHFPSRALGPPAHAQRPRSAASTTTVTKPTRLNAAKRRQLSREDAAAAAWLEAFNKGGFDYKPDVAREMLCIFSACDALLCSFITHYASGFA